MRPFRFLSTAGYNVLAGMIKWQKSLVLCEPGKEVTAVITTKITRDGEKRILEIPAGFHLPGTEVAIRQSGNSLILEPLESDWQWLKNISCNVISDALDEIQSAINEEIANQERPELDKLFK
jgi:antitoxin VapB